MLQIVSVSFMPLVGFIIVGIIMILFPGFVLNLKNFNASMSGNLFDNNLLFRDSALWTTRLMGIVFIFIGIGLFMLVNGWLDQIF